PVCPSRRTALRRSAHRRTPRAGPPRGASHLARSHLDATVDALGFPQPGHQPRRLLPPGREPCPSLAGLPRRRAVCSQDRPLLQGAATPARILAAAVAERDGPELARTESCCLALERPARQDRRRHHRLDARYPQEPGGVSAADLPEARPGVPDRSLGS